jgi:hypothetical protein
MEPSKVYIEQYAGIGIATDYVDASTFSADWMMWAVPVAGKDIRRWLVSGFGSSSSKVQW